MTEPTTRAQLRASRPRLIDRVLTPAFRRWAYGVGIALVGAAVFAGWIQPEASPIAGLLLMALLYVDKTGEPRT